MHRSAADLKQTSKPKMDITRHILNYKLKFPVHQMSLSEQSLPEERISLPRLSSHAYIVFASVRVSHINTSFPCKIQQLQL